MATAGQIIERAFKRILVGAADAAPEPDEYADAIADLNAYMAGLEANGIRLGYTVVDNVSDVVTVPSGAELAIIANLAVTIAPDYNGAISPALGQQAKDGLNTLRKLGRPKIATQMPSTLARGSGSEEPYTWAGGFYSPTISALLSLAGNELTTDIEVADTPILINGYWNQRAAVGIQSDVFGRLTSLQERNVTVTVSVALSATGDGEYTFRLMNNGVSVASTAATLSTTPADVVISHTLILSPYDYLELHVEADAHTNDLVVVDGQFEVC